MHASVAQRSLRHHHEIHHPNFSNHPIFSANA
uniref:Uncharacterized protein n=1 Tax=Arundo donax TaxID=35708 RepID=A0A0A9B902_ARUDO